MPDTVRAVEEAYGAVILPLPKVTAWLLVVLMERVEALASGSENLTPQKGKSGVNWITDPAKKHPPYAKLVPLNEIIAESMHVAPASLKVKALYDTLTEDFAPEFEILLKRDINDLEKAGGEALAEAVLKVRNGNIFISPGYDGEYGVVKIEPDAVKAKEIQAQQAELF